MATTEQITARLESAEEAYDQLVTGKMAKVLVDQNGERIEFTPANRSDLLAYIDSLKAQLGTANIGPLRVFL